MRRAFGGGSATKRTVTSVSRRRSFESVKAVEDSARDLVHAPGPAREVVEGELTAGGDPVGQGKNRRIPKGDAPGRLTVRKRPERAYSSTT